MTRRNIGGAIDLAALAALTDRATLGHDPRKRGGMSFRRQMRRVRARIERVWLSPLRRAAYRRQQFERSQ